MNRKLKPLETLREIDLGCTRRRAPIARRIFPLYFIFYFIYMVYICILTASPSNRNLTLWLNIWISRITKTQSKTLKYKFSLTSIPNYQFTFTSHPSCHVFRSHALVCLSLSLSLSIYIYIYIKYHIDYDKILSLLGFFFDLLTHISLSSSIPA